MVVFTWLLGGLLLYYIVARVFGCWVVLNDCLGGCWGVICLMFWCYMVARVLCGC